MRMETNNANKALVLPDLSYKIIGACFKVFNNLGWGLSEKHYQKALERELENIGVNYRREAYIPLFYERSLLKKFFADFIIENKVLLELKTLPKLGYVNAKQVLGYLKSGGLRLGILVYFTRDGVKY